MATEIKYKLLCVISPNDDFHVDWFTSESAAKTHAQGLQELEDCEYKIQAVITTTTGDVFSVAAHKPNWETVANDMAGVYADSIDWKNEYFLALSQEDQAKVREVVEQSTDDCVECGWTFEDHYLSDTDRGRICDRCEEDLEDEEENNED